jgi:translation initiation factor IF-3
VFTLFAALNIARERGLDLVEVAPNSVPPVCRLMDYGRYKYEQQKKDQEAHRAQRTNDLKEVRMAPVIDDHDIETKTNMIRRFVEEGDKVKVTIQFRGAQMRHQEIGRDVLERILTMLRGVAVLERPIIMEGRNMSMFVGAAVNRQAAPAAAGEERAPVSPARPMGVPAANRMGAPTVGGASNASGGGRPVAVGTPRPAVVGARRPTNGSPGAAAPAESRSQPADGNRTSS